MNKNSDNFLWMRTFENKVFWGGFADGSSILNEEPAVLGNVTAAEWLTIVTYRKGKLFPNRSWLFLDSKTFILHLSVFSVSNTF